MARNRTLHAAYNIAPSAVSPLSPDTGPAHDRIFPASCSFRHIPTKALRLWVYLFDVNIRNYYRRFEYDLIIVDTDILAFNLFNEVSDVVRKTEEVFLVGVFAGFAGDAQLFSRIVITERAATLDAQHVVAGDAVIENNATFNPKIVGVFR